MFPLQTVCPVLEDVAIFRNPLKNLELYVLISSSKVTYFPQFVPEHNKLNRSEFSIWRHKFNFILALVYKIEVIKLPECLRFWCVGTLLLIWQYDSKYVYFNKLNTPDIFPRLKGGILGLFLLCLGCMKHVFQIPYFFSLCLNTNRQNP
jgi:hypothetical protein